MVPYLWFFNAGELFFDCKRTKILFISRALLNLLAISSTRTTNVPLTQGTRLRWSSTRRSPTRPWKQVDEILSRWSKRASSRWWWNPNHRPLPPHNEGAQALSQRRSQIKVMCFPSKKGSKCWTLLSSLDPWNLWNWFNRIRIIMGKFSCTQFSSVW